ncbi:MAG: hypothetical protein LBL58_14905 [Tannerellaceae bacterium]|nr:hypothetical protein [Tannerellaceae bacterium]
MNRIATTGLSNLDNLLLSKTLSIMTGYDLIVGQSYSLFAHRYDLKADINLCQWSESFIYCMGAFTERLIVEQRYGENFVSQGSVLKELVWFMSRFNQIDFIYGVSIIKSIEKVIVNYAAKYYDVIFVYSDTANTENDESEENAGTSLKGTINLLEANNLQYQIIDASDKESALSAMVNFLGMSPILSADKALTKAQRELNFK